MTPRNPPKWRERADGSVWISHMKLTGADVDRLSGVRHLTVWAVSFPDGMLGRLRDLEFLDMRGGSGKDLELYGLARLNALPDLTRLRRLRRVSLGQLRSLADWTPLLQLRALEELVLMNKVHPDERVFEELGRRKHLKRFEWSAPDEPLGRVEEITRLVGRPRPAAQCPEAWFAANVSGR